MECWIFSSNPQLTSPTANSRLCPSRASLTLIGLPKASVSPAPSHPKRYSVYDLLLYKRLTKFWELVGRGWSWLTNAFFFFGLLVAGIALNAVYTHFQIGL